MEAVILAAGFGTRIKKAFPLTPKPMLPVGGKPLIQDQIEHLKRFGVEKVNINLHYQPEKITGFLGNGSNLGVNVNYSFEKKILGTSGALNNFRTRLKETFLVLYGDILTRVDIEEFLEFHRKKNAQASLLVHKTDHPEDSDLVELDNDNKICRIYTSPHPQPILHTNLSSAAIYILEPEVLQYLPEGFSDFMEYLFPFILERGANLYGYISDEYSKDIGTPERYGKAMKDISLKSLVK